jgi:short-subunit dehydrogenase
MSSGDGFADRYGPWALVAGASEGIGEHLARQVAAAGVDVLLVARRPAVLEALAASIGEDTGGAVECRTLAVDLATEDAATRLLDATADLDIGLLAYNAGADTMARRFLDRPLDDVLGMVQRNVVTPTTLCHHLGARMRERGRGGILLVGSMAGLAGTGRVATYAATKAYGQVLAEGLWRELRDDGVDVLALLAGATATPALERSGARVTEELPTADPAEVAREALAALGHGPVHVPGEAVRAMFDALGGVSRVDLIEAMTAGTALLYPEE